MHQMMSIDTQNKYNIASDVARSRIALLDKHISRARSGTRRDVHVQGFDLRNLEFICVNDVARDFHRLLNARQLFLFGNVYKEFLRPNFDI